MSNYIYVHFVTLYRAAEMYPVAEIKYAIKMKVLLFVIINSNNG